ncbi:MAG: 50S ribosomal protein L22 [Candidatus Woesebacteria bacterium GW2011_GWA1_41_13b]|uniref:50S ribosomal protein L22 n=1 Tax=Candidatus Woesebacteria bacterium GW2011_GWA1_41_13b TaxID=1618555 RepID=A0A0G0X5S7_9BACT|nr:MAG: 50S ribosomal protein L22 [Candidatus Woesebacteria bacterium GW2011_GWA1_41_13b]
MMITARASFVRMSPRKLRIVARAIGSLKPLEAISQLKLMNQRAAEVMLDVFQQAMGNAKNNFKISPETLKTKSVQIEEGPRLKRRDAHAHGARFDAGIRRKRMAHVIVILEGKE